MVVTDIEFRSLIGPDGVVDDTEPYTFTVGNSVFARIAVTVDRSQKITVESVIDGQGTDNTTSQETFASGTYNLNVPFDSGTLSTGQYTIGGTETTSFSSDVGYALYVQPDAGINSITITSIDNQTSNPEFLAGENVPVDVEVDVNAPGTYTFSFETAGGQSISASDADRDYSKTGVTTATFQLTTSGLSAGSYTLVADVSSESATSQKSFDVEPVVSDITVVNIAKFDSNDTKVVVDDTEPYSFDEGEDVVVSYDITVNSSTSVTIESVIDGNTTGITKSQSFNSSGTYNNLDIGFNSALFNSGNYTIGVTHANGSVSDTGNSLEVLAAQTTSLSLESSDADSGRFGVVAGALPSDDVVYRINDLSVEYRSEVRRHNETEWEFLIGQSQLAQLQSLLNQAGMVSVVDKYSGGFDAVDRSNGDATFSVVPPSGREDVRPVGTYLIKEYEIEYLSSDGQKVLLSLVAVPDREKTGDSSNPYSTITSPPSLSNDPSLWFFEFEYGDVLTSRVTSNLTSSNDAQLQTYSLEIIASPIEVRVIEESCGLPTSAVIREIPDATNFASVDTDGDNIVSITPPQLAQDDLASGQYAVLNWETVYNRGAYVVSLEVVKL